MKIFITGTDTDVGKTLISAWLCLHTKSFYWKPIQTGCELDNDAKRVATLSKTIICPTTYNFKAPLSPHVAAQAENIDINIENIHLPTKKNLIIEGAGGVMVPLTNNFLIIDLIKLFDLPVIIVARSTLGTINHTLLTVAALKHYNIKILGIIMNGPSNKSNRAVIEHYTQVKVLYEFDQLTKISYSQLKMQPLSKELNEIWQ